MADSSAAAFPQRFVEHDPIASFVWYQYRPYIDSSLVISFDGVHIPENARKSFGGSSSGGADVSDEGESDSEEEEEETTAEEKVKVHTPYSQLPTINKERLCEEGYLRGLIYELLSLVSSQLEKEGESSPSILKAIKRYEKKWYEKLEDEPHELLASSVILELVQLSPSHLNLPLKYAFGQRLNIIEILASLKKRPTKYWRDLLHTWFIDAKCAEVRMIPDPRLATKISQAEQKALEERTKKLGQAGLRKQKDLVARAVKENKVNLTEDVLARMPPVPPAKEIPKLPESVSLLPVTGEGLHAVLCATATRFSHLRLCLDTSAIPVELRPYLVLFQELLLESDLAVPGEEVLPWSKVVEGINEDTVTLECGVGFGNSTFSCSYLPSIFYIYGISEPELFERLCLHITNNVSLTFFFILYSSPRLSTSFSSLSSFSFVSFCFALALLHQVQFGQGAYHGQEPVERYRGEQP